MFRTLPMPLEDAPYYHLHDWQDEDQILQSELYVDPDPAATAAMAAEITRRRLALDPAWKPGSTQWDYFQLPEAEINASIVAAGTRIQMLAPPELPHHMLVPNRTEPYSRAYRLVSAAWRDAIEAAEPGQHQFFPHRLQFLDRAVDSHFVHRCPQLVELRDWFFNVDPVEDAFDRIIAWRATCSGRAVRISLNQEMLAGRQMVRDYATHKMFLSRAIAEKLHPLLPPLTSLIPVDLESAETLGGTTGRVLRIPGPWRIPGIPGGRTGPEPHEFDRFDPALADMLRALAEPWWSDTEDEPRWAREWQQAEKKLARIMEAFGARVQSETIERHFEIMDFTLRFDGPLQKNNAFQICWLACHDRPEAEVLRPARYWAQDPDPRRRIAVIRALSRTPDEDESPHPETFAILNALLDDPDPLVAEKAVGIIAWMIHPAYEHALRSRRAAMERHPDEYLRDYYYRCVTSNYDPRLSPAEEAARDAIAQASISGLFNQALAQQRADPNNSISPALEALHKRNEPEVARIALLWAQDPDPDLRRIAALALDRVMEDEAPSPDAITAIRILAVDADPSLVVLALKAFAAITHWGPYQPHALGPVSHCEQHPAAEVRTAYASLFARPGTSITAQVLARLSADPHPSVRLEASMKLQNLAVFMGKRDPTRNLVATALANMLRDTDAFVRVTAIDGLTKLQDKRAADAILAELAGNPHNFLAQLGFLMMAIVEHPDRRYLPGLERWQAQLGDVPAIEEAIKACKVRRWFF